MSLPRVFDIFKVVYLKSGRPSVKALSEAEKAASTSQSTTAQDIRHINSTGRREDAE